MKDYSFGNYLSALRCDKKLSQYQLGVLVGVSDKAVSKWENGDSKPRASTCMKLASVLGVSIDDLLLSREQTQLTHQQNDDASLWENARHAMLDFYGATPPIVVLSRFESEKLALQNLDVIRYLATIGEIRKHALEACCDIFVRGQLGNSFIAWLLGATEVNPLPPHTVCPQCHSVIFHSEVRDAWDLPESVCSCGAHLIREGHDIPLIGFIHSLHHAKAFEITVPPSMVEYAEHNLTSCLQGTEDVVPFCYEDKSIQVGQAFLIISKKKVGITGEDVLHISFRDRFKKYNDYASFRFTEDQRLENLSFFKQETFHRRLDALTTRGVLQKCLDQRATEPYHTKPDSDLYASMSEIVKAADAVPLSFSKLMRIDGVYHGAGIWKNNGEAFVKNGTAAFDSLSAFREDVEQAVQSRLPNACRTEIGIAFSIMDHVRMGGSLTEEMERVLLEIGIEPWYIEHIKKIKYQFPKAHIIGYLVGDLLQAWNSQSAPIPSR